jgi:hypothetical protein
MTIRPPPVLAMIAAITLAGAVMATVRMTTQAAAGDASRIVQHMPAGESRNQKLAPAAELLTVDARRSGLGVKERAGPRAKSVRTGGRRAVRSKKLTSARARPVGGTATGMVQVVERPTQPCFLWFCGFPLFLGVGY